MRITLCDFDKRQVKELDLRVSSSARVADLYQALGISPQQALYVGARQLDKHDTIFDTPLVQGSQLAVGHPGYDPQAPPDGARVIVTVISGPAKGTWWWLGCGKYTLGYGTGAQLQINDSRVADRHADLIIIGDSHTVNITINPLEPVQLGDNPCSIMGVFDSNQILSVGDSQLQWWPVEVSGPRWQQTTDRRLVHQASPQIFPAAKPVTVAFPEPVQREYRYGQLVLSAVIPLLVGILLAAIFHQPSMLLFAIMSPVTLTVQLGLSLWQHRKNSRHYRHAYANSCADLDRQVADYCRYHMTQSPPLATIVRYMYGSMSDLWWRRYQDQRHLWLRVGTHDRLCDVEFTAHRPVDIKPVAVAVPASINLAQIACLTIGGQNKNAMAEFMRTMIIHLAASYCPSQVSLLPIIGKHYAGEAWWMSWLPQCTFMQSQLLQPGHIIGDTADRNQQLDELEHVIRTRMADRSRAVYLPAIIVVLLGEQTQECLTRMHNVAQNGKDCGVYIVGYDCSLNISNAHCDVTPGLVEVTISGGDKFTAITESVSLGLAEKIARRLSPYVDSAATSSAARLPSRLCWLDLFTHDSPATVAGICKRWQTKPALPTPVARLGVDDQGRPFDIDFSRDGPHMVMAGATGSGKSVVLATIITSLMVSNSPDELSLLLIDFKGGSTFAAFEECPHVGAVLCNTDNQAGVVFTSATTMRVIASLQAEIRRRESLLHKYGGEIDEYWRQKETLSAWTPLPRMVIVIDEFARVSEEVPDFLPELVAISAKGRSLGIHLILATQSIQGKLSSELRNNLDIRLSLRHNESSDSIDIIDVPDAAYLPGDCPGRAIIVFAKDEKRQRVHCQVGYVGESNNQLPVEIVAVDGVKHDNLMQAVSVAAQNNYLPITDAICQAAREIPHGPLFKPLLPPLPKQLTPARLGAPSGDSSALPVGVIDDIAHQSQPMFVLNLHSGERLLFAGGSGSGKSAALAGIVHYAAVNCDPDQVWLYVLHTGSSKFAQFEEIPQCGAVVSVSESDRVERLLSWLEQQIHTRSGVAGEPFIVVAIDDWDEWEKRAESNSGETGFSYRMVAIANRGVTVGIHIILSGNMSMLRSPIAANYSMRLLLPAPDDLRYSYCPRGTILPPPMPGLAVDSVTGRWVKCVDTLPNIEELKVNIPQNFIMHRRVQTFPSLPERVQLPPGDELIDLRHCVLGIGGVNLSPQQVDFTDHGRLLVISGPRGCGKSTALITLIRQLQHQNIGCLILCPEDSPLAKKTWNQKLTRLIVSDFVDDRYLRDGFPFRTERSAIIIDDCDSLIINPDKDKWEEKPYLLDDVARAGSRNKHILIMAGNLAPVFSGHQRVHSGVIHYIARHGSRLIFSPKTQQQARDYGLNIDGNLLQDDPPGRAFLADSEGRCTYLQVFQPGN